MLCRFFFERNGLAEFIENEKQIPVIQIHASKHAIHIYLIY